MLISTIVNDNNRYNLLEQELCEEAQEHEKRTALQEQFDLKLAAMKVQNEMNQAYNLKEKIILQDNLRAEVILR
jgi:hypothetical protein